MDLEDDRNHRGMSGSLGTVRMIDETAGFSHPRRGSSSAPTEVLGLTNLVVSETVWPMHDVAVIDDPAAAEASLDPIRVRLLSALADPGSATTLAAKTGLTRQKVNYHLRALEHHGLIELVETRRKGNCTERVMQATAASYVISPTALPAVAPDPARAPDQRSARWLLGVAGRLVGEVGELVARSGAARKPVATLGIDSEVRFASARDRAAFAVELADAVNGLVAKYHDGHAARGRDHRFVVALHPKITKPTTEEPES
jgi:DNA-binding transcriptional ArsR family regulator